MIGRQLSQHKACRLFDSHDLDDTRARISEVMQPHKLSLVEPIEDFRAQMSFLPIAGIGIGTIRFGRVDLRLEHVEDYHLMIFCLSGRARIQTWNHETTIGGAKGVYLAPGTPVRAEFSDDCEQLVIRMETSAVRQACGDMRPRMNNQIDLNRPAFRPWIGLMQSMLGDDAGIDLLRTDRRLQSDYESMFVRTLLHGHGVEDSTAPSIAPASVRRAETFIRAHLAEPLNLDRIATAAGVPTRTLLDSFQRFRSTAPMQYVRELRLDLARAQMEKPGVADTITSIALGVGFTHLGRFSNAYRTRFGERPVDTWRKARRNRPV